MSKVEYVTCPKESFRRRYGWRKVEAALFSVELLQGRLVIISWRPKFSSLINAWPIVRSYKYVYDLLGFSNEI